MKQLDVAILLVEGRLRWTSDGILSSSRSKWTRDMHLGLLFSVQSSGIWINSTESLAETREYLSRLELWMMKGKHSGLNTRPKPQTIWGDRRDSDYCVHFIQGLDGVGPGVAKAIYDKFGFPFKLTVTQKDLETVPGVGPKRAEKIWRLFNG